jgi:hypothetical protein
MASEVLPFVLFLLAGCATAIQILSLVLFFVWGRPVSWLELAALLGSAVLITMAFYTLFRPRIGVWGALIASVWPLCYYGVAIPAALINMVRLGSEYPLRLFIPPVLLVLTVAYSLAAVMRTGIATTAARQRRRWIVVSLWAALVLTAAPVLSGVGHAPVDFFVPRKVVMVPMSWTLNHSNYLPNFIHLETLCANEQADSNCFCGMEFRETTSSEFLNYIQSFDKHQIPVQYEVFYDRNGEAISANLVSVGTWAYSRFHTNEQLISVGARNIPLGKGITHRNPQDCFVPLQKSQ